MFMGRDRTACHKRVKRRGGLCRFSDLLDQVCFTIPCIVRSSGSQISAGVFCILSLRGLEDGGETAEIEAHVGHGCCVHRGTVGCAGLALLGCCVEERGGRGRGILVQQTNNLSLEHVNRKRFAV